MSDLVLLGPPGSGKGTQASRLAEGNGWVHLATGDLFRDHVRRGTGLGGLARSYMDRGELVPDEVVVRMVRDRLSGIPASTRVIFDGFPRTVPQAKALTHLLEDMDRSLARVLLLLVPLGVLLSRIAGRYTCESCQAVYNLETNPPRRPGICDRCGAKIAPGTRADDAAPDVVATRHAVYENETAPLVAYYRAQGLLEDIDATGLADEVATRIERAIA